MNQKVAEKYKGSITDEKLEELWDEYQNKPVGHFTIRVTFSVTNKTYIDDTSYQQNCKVQNRKIKFFNSTLYNTRII